MNILEFEPLRRIRQNHALEHATIHLLTRSDPSRHFVGRSTPRGFYIYGQVDTQTVADAVSEALARLRAGESDLAIHPRCGTGIATTGILAGLAAFATLGFRRKRTLADLPAVITATTLAALVAQPLGLTVQQQFTTDANVEGVRIARVERLEAGRMVAHRVILERD
jgi:hypothetical protein